MFSKIEKEAKKLFTKAKGTHDWDHTERVLNLVIHIGKKEKADIEILKLSAVLHDIGREEEIRSNWKICHAERGAELAEKILKRYKIPKEKIEKIIDCIRTHRFKGKNIPKSLEAKVLYDADKLDAIGAIGLGRAFVFAGELGAKVHDPKVTVENSIEYSREDTAFRHFQDKLIKIKDKLLTDEGKLLAKSRHQFMVDFFDRINKETNGEY